MLQIHCVGYIWRKGSGKQRIDSPPVQEKLKGNFLKASKPVIQFTSDGKQVRVFSSFSESANSTGGLPKQIFHAARGIGKTAYRYKWTIPGRADDLYPVD